MRPSILLTGATGALGSALLPELLSDFDQHDIYCLVRGNSAEDARQRLAAILSNAGLTADSCARVKLLHGDVSAPQLGLAQQAYSEILSSVEQIYHLAASVDFDLPLSVSRQANVDSAIQILDFSRRCRYHSAAQFRLNYVSTAYICGKRSGLLKESELGLGQEFWNSYEQSKLEAEQLVELAKAQTAITIYRPSQIVGDSGSGKINKFFGFYEFIGLAARGRSDILVADPGMRADMVPLDYVCSAIRHFSRQSAAIGQTYHLVAGLRHSITVDQVVDAVLGVMRAANESVAVARPRIIPLERLETDTTALQLARYNASAQKLLLRTYQPYLAYERDFDCGATQQLLQAAGISIPCMESVIKVTTQYALSFRTRKTRGTTPAPVQ